MKTKLLLSSFLATLLISGCGSSDNNDDPVNTEDNSTQVETTVKDVDNNTTVAEKKLSTISDINLTLPKVGSSVPLNAMNYPLADVTFSNGKVLHATWGIGSGATHKAGDDNNTFYTISDRGVNIKCKDDEKVIGIDICTAGKIFPFPNFTPAIIEYKIEGNNAVIQRIIELKDRDGKNISGVSNPISNFSEIAYDIEGNELPLDPNGVDSEAMVALKDGTFWIAEEYTSSILHIAADGKVIKRLVPAGLEGEYSDATYDVEGSLPAIIAKRHANRGIESIAISPDELSLYFMMQSPLEVPDADAYKKSPHVRLYKMEIANPSNTQEYLYTMDAPDTFLKDNETKKRKQSDIKISEMVTLENDVLMILERVSATTKLYKVELSSESVVTPEQSANLELDASGVTSLTKMKVFDTDLEEGYPNKVEGIAHLGGTKFLLINDNDFGIGSDGTVATIADINTNKAVDTKHTHGRVVFFKTNGTFEQSVKVGILPDMVKFTHDGTKVLVANEGEVVGNEGLDAPLFDPYGTVSIINTKDYKVTTVDFKSITTAPEGAKIRKGAEIARDFEPEYITISADDNYAWVSLQESNAMAKIDLATNTLVDVKGLGFKDLSLDKNALDYKKDGNLIIETTPAGVFGMYQPDTVASYSVAGVNYVVTANEGDDRDDFYSESTKASKLTHTAIGDIGDLRVNPDLGDADGDGDYEELYSYGTRSFSIWNGSTGELVFDSGNTFAKEVADKYPTQFNTRDKKGKFKGLDARSEKKGIEPEALALATINDTTFAYIGLEKQGGFFVYNVTDPKNATMVEYNNDINYSLNSEDSNISSTINDLGPEGMVTFTQDDKNYLAVANEVSGTVSVYELANDGKATKMGTHYSGIYNESAAEIVDYDAKTKQLFVTNASTNSVDVLNIADVTNITKVKSLSMAPYGTGINSVSVSNGRIAVAVEIKE